MHYSSLRARGLRRTADATSMGILRVSAVASSIEPFRQLKEAQQTNCKFRTRPYAR